MLASAVCRVDEQETGTARNAMKEVYQDCCQDPISPHHTLQNPSIDNYLVNCSTTMGASYITCALRHAPHSRTESSMKPKSFMCRMVFGHSKCGTTNAIGVSGRV